MPPEPAPAGVAASTDTAVFAGGCFWGVEAVFEHLKGVSTAVSGYAGGKVPVPIVRAGEHGHHRPRRVRPGGVRSLADQYDQLLQVYFTVAHDPTQLNRQGPDVGTQYRSAMFYRNDRAAATRPALHRASSTAAKVYRRLDRHRGSAR